MSRKVTLTALNWIKFGMINILEMLNLNIYKTDK
jgi:hypothetical protein